ncbi:hypothetical protein FPRO05_10938 [Fusarium proliferatum]|uniref:Uncharacterized protein n=1 Tax=Gibberella intermedia TaxID=948311 RepID=A0A365NAT2_GIBIN|nr:hypothetical protein FPRO05_10938 [Fusarium proliferatum]
MTTDSLTVSRNAVIALSIIIPLIFIILLIIIFWLWRTLRCLQSHESDEIPLRSSHSTTSMPSAPSAYSTTTTPPAYCVGVIGPEASIKPFLEARKYGPTSSYDCKFGHFRIVCNPQNGMGVDGIVMLQDANLNDKLKWAYGGKEYVLVGRDPVMPMERLPENCKLGLSDPFPRLIKQISRKLRV